MEARCVGASLNPPLRSGNGNDGVQTDMRQLDLQFAVGDFPGQAVRIDAPDALRRLRQHVQGLEADAARRGEELAEAGQQLALLRQKLAELTEERDQARSAAAAARAAVEAHRAELQKLKAWMPVRLQMATTGPH